MIEDHHVGFEGLAEVPKLLDLAGAHERGGLGLALALIERPDDHGAGLLGQRGQLPERVALVKDGLREADGRQNGPLRADVHGLAFFGGRHGEQYGP